MAFTRAYDDQCSYNKNLAQSTGLLQFTMDPSKYYNCSDCMVNFGIIGGNNVSTTTGNMVDVESELLNITRQLSRCPERKYIPQCKNCAKSTGLPCDSSNCKNEKLSHLKNCDMFNYAPRINNVGYSLKYKECDSKNNSTQKYPPQMNPVIRR